MSFMKIRNCFRLVVNTGKEVLHVEFLGNIDSNWGTEFLQMLYRTAPKDIGLHVWPKTMVV